VPGWIAVVSQPALRVADVVARLRSLHAMRREITPPDPRVLTQSRAFEMRTRAMRSTMRCFRLVMALPIVRGMASTHLIPTSVI